MSAGQDARSERPATGMGSPEPITERPGHRARLELADGPAKDDTEGKTESGLQSFELSRGTE